MGDAFNGTSPRAGRPDPILAALLSLAQRRALDPLSQALQRGVPAPGPREPVRRGRQQLPSSLLDIEPFGDLFDLPMFDPRQLDPEAPRMFEYFTPREEELLQLLDRLRRLPPRASLPEYG